MSARESSLDTSVVLRLLVREPESQFAVADAFLKERLALGDKVFVSDLVLAETYFALQAFYRMPKSVALQVLALFAQHSGVVTSEVAASVLKVPNLASAKPGFVDRLIQGAAHSEGRTLVTFEKAMAKLPGAHVLS